MVYKDSGQKRQPPTAKDSLRLKDLPARLGGTNEAPTFSKQECCKEAMIVFECMGISFLEMGV